MRSSVIWLTGISQEQISSFGKRLAQTFAERKTAAEYIGQEILHGLLGIKTDNPSWEAEASDKASRIAILLANHGVYAIVEGSTLSPEVRIKVRNAVEASGAMFIEISLSDAVKGSFDLLVDPNEEHAIRKVLTYAVLESPVILVGRGGSGTRLLSALARSLGVFLGSRINETGDSLELVEIGYTLFHEAMEGQINAKDAEDLKSRALNIVTNSTEPLHVLWGWKLPEMMMFLPQCLEAFPKAKLIHMVRHPISLSLRNHSHLTDIWTHHLGRRALKTVSTDRGIDLEILRVAPPWLKTAYSWELQVSTATKFLRSSWPKERLLEVKYEDLCTDQTSFGKAVASFLQMPYCCWHPKIDSSRTFQEWNRQDPRADQVWSICGQTAALFGYTR